MPTAGHSFGEGSSYMRIFVANTDT